MITRVCAALEECSVPGTLDQAKLQKLEEHYSNKRHQCSRHACYFYHEGFINKSSLSQHTNRHDKPFCCTEMDCTRMYIGWSTQRELRNHMSQYHPDPAAFAWKFPYVKKPPVTYKCNQCPKTYNRANSLKTHQEREHGNDRRFKCQTCQKGFVRKYELGRHENTHRGTETRGTAVQTPVTGESQATPAQNP